MHLPDQDSVAAHLAAFEAELAQAGSPRDAQAVRDRYLGRKNSVVAGWMQLIASAAADDKRAIGRWANELKQGIETRWTAFQARAEQQADPVDTTDVTLPGRIP